MIGLLRRKTFFRANTMKPRYDVVIIGAGGHGLAAAYYLAKRHGVRDVAVIERAYIGAGGTGRNTTIVRCNYKTPETIAFYRKSYWMFRELSMELDYNLLLTPRGLFWMAHSENQLRLQRERAFINQEFDVNTVFLTPQEIKEVCPQLDMQAGGKYPGRQVSDSGRGLSSRRLHYPARCGALGVRCPGAGARGPRPPGRERHGHHDPGRPVRRG
jgi:sarcosine oxidase, subunit beta